jgi:hypothetical protein
MENDTAIKMGDYDQFWIQIIVFLAKKLED